MKRFPREVLNEIKWKDNRLFDVVIYYVNRGSPNNTATKSGRDIIKMDSFYVVFAGVPQETYIPYHRFKKIELDGKIIFER